MTTVENLETFYLIWFGNSMTNELQQQLRTIINYLLVFENEQECLQYIHSLSKDDQIILIIKGQSSQQIIPQIVHLRQILSIFIYSNEKKTNLQWTKNFKKIKAIVHRHEDLIQRIQADHIERQSHQFDEPFSYSIFNSKVHNKKLLSTNTNTHSIHFQLLIDCLIHLQSFPSDKTELITLCKQQYDNNSHELNILEDFEKNYTAERSIWWYTRHSFLYRLLNKSLRTENMNLLILLRFFLYDIKQELDKNKISSSIRVYRGQLMSREELDYLTKFIGNFISINSFLLTSFHREQIRSYLSSSSSISIDTEKVFFEINANPRSDKMKSFSNITSLSYYTNRDEVLFMIGSIFRLIHIDCDIDGIWNIQLVLCSNKDHQLQSIIQEKKTQLDIIDNDFLSLGFLFQDMEKYDDAQQYYYYILNQLSKDDQENIARCYHALGEITQKKGDYETSLKWYNRSIEIDVQLSKSDDVNIATSYNSIAVVYSKKGDYTLAIESSKKALEIWKKIYGDEHSDVAMCYNNMGIIYQEEKNYSEALECYHKAWNIRQKCFSIEHPSLAQSHACIGNIHYMLDRYDLALEHYNLALEIFNKSLVSHHLDTAMMYRNIGLVYQGKREFQQALLYMEKALTMYRQSLSETHPDIVQIEQIIRRISSKL